MSNTENDPRPIVCVEGGGAEIQLLEPREVPLGGPRAMDVRRTLPQRSRSLIGAWCFLDHYGPDRVDETGGMRVPRHPHTGLQTVSWLFTGLIEHRDSAGFHAIVRPGELNLMTAGRGISHSEFSTPDTRVLHGVQLWTALPEHARHGEPGFDSYAPEPVCLPGAVLRVFMGALAGSVSPVPTHTPLVGAEILLDPGASLELELDPRFEHGILLDSGELCASGVDVPRDHLAYLPPGRGTLSLRAGEDARPARLILIGGEPLGEKIVMWWNFLGRSHEEIAEYRARWQYEIGAEDVRRPGDPRACEAGASVDPDAPARFGHFPEGQPAPLPAPVLPNVRIKPRG